MNCTLFIPSSQRLIIKAKNIMNEGLHSVVNTFLSLCKLFMTVWSYPLIFTFDLFSLIVKGIRMILTFVVGGLQGVLKALGIGVFGQKIHYSILKENGQYLRIKDKPLEDVFTCQLYDYSIRKFMTISSLGQDINVAELQFWSSTGLNYLTTNLEVKKILALHNSSQKIKKYKQQSNIEYLQTDYANNCSIPEQDILIFFNRSNEIDSNNTDVIKMLTFIKNKLNLNGYAVFGNCFTSEGEIKVFEELIDAFQLKIMMEEDITRNIVFSRRILGRIYRKRIFNWLFGRVKEFLANVFSYSQVLINFWNFLQRAAGLKQQLSIYKIYILQHDI